LFKALLTGEGLTSPQSTEFKLNIRRLNSHISFASLTCTKEAKVPGHGPYVYKVEGQMVRRLSTAQARAGQIPQFSQVYFHDPAEAHSVLKQHPNVQNFSPWLTNKMLDVYNHIRQHNPYALSYKMLKDVATGFELTGRPVPELTLLFNNRKDSTHRTYNAPNAQATSEICVILEGIQPDSVRKRAVAVCHKDRADNGDSWVYLKVNSPEVDSLTYPMLWPLGIEGWSERDDAWHSSIERFYPPPRVLKRRVSVRTRSAL
jgi:hypothetical protein